MRGDGRRGYYHARERYPCQSIHRAGAVHQVPRIVTPVSTRMHRPRLYLWFLYLEEKGVGPSASVSRASVQRWEQATQGESGVLSAAQMRAIALNQQ